MKLYKKQFIEFLLNNNSLKFGDFTLKSGRKSPYFLNVGMLYSGNAITSLGAFYAETIVDNLKDDFEVVFGPAYKGIPLSVITISELYHKFNYSKDYSFNRKEAKTHGDKGLFVGKKITADDRIIIVDDVITAGTAIRESLELLRKDFAPKISGIVVLVDRMEKGQGEKSAIEELKEKENISVYPIITIKDIIEFIKNEDYDLSKFGMSKEEIVEKMNLYREKYGTN